MQESLIFHVGICVCIIVFMDMYNILCLKILFFVFFVFVFVIFFYVGTHLARGYSSGDPRNYYKYTQNTITTIKSYTYTLCGR